MRSAVRLRVLIIVEILIGDPGCVHSILVDIFSILPHESLPTLPNPLSIGHAHGLPDRIRAWPFLPGP